RQYNALNQLTLISSPTFAAQYVYSATQNNGRIVEQLGGPSGWTVNYQYDALNRLSGAVAADNSWGQSFTYDRFGNLTQQNVTAGSAPSMSLIVDPATNHVVNAAYDANGNQTYGNEPVYYDAENRIVGGLDARDAYYYYAYDASNERIWKNGPQGEEFSFYGLQGERLATFTPSFGQDANHEPTMIVTQAEVDGYFGSRLVYWSSTHGAGSPEQDRIGSVRFDSAYGLSTFFPYGTEMGAGTANDRVKFGTYRRDSNSGLDYAMNRYYLSNWGRFMSSDPYSGSMDLKDPNSLNRYAYAWDDPINSNDPSGLCIIDGQEYPDPCFSISSYAGGGGGGGGGSMRVQRVILEPPAEWDSLSTECERGLETALPSRTKSAGIPGWLATLKRTNAASNILQQAANKYGIDWSLLAAIAIRETSFANVNQSGGGKGTGIFQIDLGENPSVTAAQASDLTWAAD
ncbi:MAG: RHS repeat-associated core domain-containing protein, partial [Candidatus Dormibacteraceae bacterium]